MKACSSGRVCSSHAWNRKSGGKRQFAKNKKERCSYSPPRHWMEVLIHLLDLLATGRDYNRVYYVSVSKTLFLECNFCLIKKKKIPNNLQLFPVDCGTGTCGSQILDCAEGRKQEELFICWTVFGTTNLSEYIERQCPWYCVLTFLNCEFVPIFWNYISFLLGWNGKE